MGKGSRRRLNWLMACGILSCCGCNQQDTERLGDVGRAIAAKFQAMSGGADGKVLSGWQTLRGNLDAATLEARVLARLRWDKTLADVKIDVRSTKGEVELKGKVNDLAQRRRAVELAETTAGTEKVVDQLEVAEHEP